MNTRSQGQFPAEHSNGCKMENSCELDACKPWVAKFNPELFPMASLNSPVFLWHLNAIDLSFNHPPLNSASKCSQAFANIALQLLLLHLTTPLCILQVWGSPHIEYCNSFRVAFLSFVNSLWQSMLCNKKCM